MYRLLLYHLGKLDLCLFFLFFECVARQTTFPWRAQKEWQDRKLDIPVSIFPTAEAVLDPEEIKKYGFNRLEEVTDQLRPEFTQNREAKLDTLSHELYSRLHICMKGVNGVCVESISMIWWLIDVAFA